MVLTNQEEHLFTFNLSAFEKTIEQQLGVEAQLFIRLGKSLIINYRYIYYINVSKQQLILSDSSFSQKHTLSASKEALKNLKSLLEASLKNQKI
jgi:DNA-binding LytR/AlgR family response regulator